MPRQDIEVRLGVPMCRLASTAITVGAMLVQAGYSLESKQHKDTKEEIYKEIMRHMWVEGPYWIASTEANINDLVYTILSPIIEDFICKTGRNEVSLYRERQLVSVDSKARGYEEFVVLDRISVRGRVYPYYRSNDHFYTSLGAAMGQCVLALKDMRDRNGRGIVYGFITTRGGWRMLHSKSRGSQSYSFKYLLRDILHIP